MNIDVTISNDVTMRGGVSSALGRIDQYALAAMFCELVTGEVQNKLLYAAAGHTAAELVVGRSDS